MSIGFPYTDHTILQSGKYKQHRLCMVPPDYLLNIYNNPKGCSDKELLKYIETNIEEIRTRPPSGKIGILPAEPAVGFICEKVAYATKKIANEALRKIRTIHDDRKKPVRSYECDKCSQWHLTAMPYEIWKKKMQTT